MIRILAPALVVAFVGSGQFGASPAAAGPTGTASRTTAAQSAVQRDGGEPTGTIVRSKRSVTKRRATVRTRGPAAAPPTRPWTIEDALPRNSRAIPRDTDDVASHGLGRVPLQQGSFGFETQNKVRSDRFSDGRRVPGLETETRQPPSYFGLSLSLPTDNKSLFPALPSAGQPK